MIYRGRKKNVEQPNCITLPNVGQTESFSSFIISRPGIYCVLTSQDNLPTEEEYTDSRGGPGEDSEEEGRALVPRILYDNSAESEQGETTLRSAMFDPY